MSNLDSWETRHPRASKVFINGMVLGCIMLFYVVHVERQGLESATMLMVPIGLFLLYLNWDAVKARLRRSSSPTTAGSIDNQTSKETA